jgi:hypothetical protein
MDLGRRRDNELGDLAWGDCARVSRSCWGRWGCWSCWVALGLVFCVLPRVSVANNRQADAPPPTYRVTFQVDGATRRSLGEVLAKYGDGSLLLLTPDGQLRTLLSSEVLEAEPATEPMLALSAVEAGQQVLQELPAGFKQSETKHYVLVYNTSDIYADWVGKLFERLHRAFYNYWKNRGVKLEEPRFPLVAIVFSDKLTYMAYAEREVGEAAGSMIGYYNMKTNRIVTYDLTGVDGLVPAGQRIASQAVINQILSRPQAERTVATIVHEAVHQLSFNSGLQTRLADNPLWLSEGMAMFFETPDVSNSQGWGTIGKVNYHNMRLFAQYVPRRSADSLKTLLADNSRFKDTALAAQAYPESWALTYFLFKTKGKGMTEYLQELSRLPPLGESTPHERLEMFKKHFGDDLERLDREFIDYIRRAR